MGVSSRFIAHCCVMLIACTAVDAALQQAGPAPTSPRTGAISGVITDGTTGRGLSGVVVTLSGTGVRVSLGTVTDSKGRFVFQYLPASNQYYLSTSKPGFVSGGLARRNANSSPTPFPLSEDEWISDANIVMWRPGGISGTVVDEKGEPVVDVPVRVLTRIPIAGTTQWATGALARTDDRGYYRIAGLVHGTYIVSVPSVLSTVPPGTSHAAVLGLPPVGASGRPLPPVAGVNLDGAWLVVGNYATPPSGVRQAYPVSFYSNARTLSEAAPVELAAGEEKRNVDFALRPVPTTRITGRVTGPPEGIAGLVVRLLQEGVEVMGAGSEQATALTRADGAFTLVGVAAGRYVLDARTGFAEINFDGSAHLPATPGLVSEQYTESLPWLPSGNLSAIVRTRHLAGSDAYSARLPIAVQSEDVSGVVLALERGATISGRVVREDGLPLPGLVWARVEAATGDPALGGPAIDQNPGKDPAGAFAIHGLQRGEYLLRVSAGSFAVKSITAGGDYTNRPFETVPGTDITGVVVTLTDRIATVSGAVRDRQGATVRDVAVILFPTDRAQWTRFGIRPTRIRATTYFGNQGYEIPRIPAGEYFVIAVDPSMRDAWQDPRFFQTAAPLATRIMLEWGASSVQDLTIQRVTLK